MLLLLGLTAVAATSTTPYRHRRQRGTSSGLFQAPQAATVGCKVGGGDVCPLQVWGQPRMYLADAHLVS